jgi:hypothetical protein
MSELDNAFFHNYSLQNFVNSIEFCSFVYRAFSTMCVWGLTLVKGQLLNCPFFVYMVDIEAGPLNYSSYNPDDSYCTAQYKEQEFVKFNNYRLLWKLGLIYKLENVSLGINISTPSLGLYSDGKRAARKKSRSNITDPSTNMWVTDYLFADFAEKKDITSGYKSSL